MRFRSTEESRRNNQVTIQSIIDTVVAMAVSIELAIYMQSMLHIAIGACVAPLLLLRTDESVAMGKRLFEKLRPKPRETSDSDVVMTKTTEKKFIELIRLVYLILLSLFVRVYSTVFCLIKNPVGSIMSIRMNWIQSVFCTDVFHEPLEIVPSSGEIIKVISETCKLEFVGNSTSELLRHKHFLIYYYSSLMVFSSCIYCYVFLDKNLPSSQKLPPLLVLLPLLFLAAHDISVYLCILIAILYRLSLKSTAILWLPLLLIPTENDSIEEHLKEERESALSKLSLAYSSLIIGLFSAKVFLLPHVIDWWNNLPTSNILNVWIMPEKLHSWHVAGAVGAGLNLIGYLFFYEKAVRKLESGTWSETFVRNVSISLKFVIYSILIYTIPAGIYITWKAIDFVKLPKFDWNPFPWW